MDLFAGLENSSTAAPSPLDLFRHPGSGQGIPDYAMPLVALHVRTDDGGDATLIWEGVYNGFRPAVPQGKWLDDVPISQGVFWIRYQGRNYNRAKGFQKLAAFAAGHTTTYKGKPSPALSADSVITGIEIGAGPNIPGLLIAYADDLRLKLAGGASYHLNFEPSDGK